MVNVYCDIQFLKKFFQKAPVKSVKDYLNADELNWISLFNFMYSDINITINIDEKKKEEQSNDIRKFISAWSQGKIGLQFKENIFAELERENYKGVEPYTLFLLETDELQTDKKVNSTGYYFINSKNWEGLWKKLLNKEQIAYLPFEKNATSWDYIRSFRHHFKNILIVDRYILQSEKKYRENLYSILRNIIPREALQYTINLLIVCGELPKNLNLENVWNKLDSFLKSDLKVYKINLSIIKLEMNTKFTHDRKILTNYFLFDSGQSFNYFNYRNLDVNTRLWIIPFSKFPQHVGMIHNLRKLIDTIKNLKKDNGKVGTETRLVGDGKNDILNLIEKISKNN